MPYRVVVVFITLASFEALEEGAPHRRAGRDVVHSIPRMPAERRTVLLVRSVPRAPGSLLKQLARLIQPKNFSSCSAQFGCRTGSHFFASRDTFSRIIISDLEMIVFGDSTLSGKLLILDLVIRGRSKCTMNSFCSRH